MRIAIVASGSLGRPAGSERAQLVLARSLRQRGHQLAVFHHEGGEILAEWDRIVEWRRPIPSGGEMRARPWTAAKALLPSVRAWRWTPNVIWLNHPSDGPLGAMLALRRAPVVCHLHLNHQPATSLTLRATLRRVNRFVAVSAAARNSWIQGAGLMADRVGVVYSPVDSEHFRPVAQVQRNELRDRHGIARDEIVVAYVGRLVPGKGLDVLVDAWSDLHRRPGSGPWRFLLAGSGSPDYETWLSGRLSMLPVLRLGWIPDPVHVYQMSDIVTVPSLVAEGAGTVILEAMACGVPVVASRVGGIPEILHEFDEWLVEPGDATALAEAIARLSASKTAWGRDSERVRAYAEERHALAGAGARLEAEFIAAGACEHATALAGTAC